MHGRGCLLTDGRILCKLQLTKTRCAQTQVHDLSVAETLDPISPFNKATNKRIIHTENTSIFARQGQSTPKLFFTRAKFIFVYVVFTLDVSVHAYMQIVSDTNCALVSHALTPTHAV